MTDNMKIASKLGYLNLPDELIVSLDEALHMKDSEVVIMVTGSQASRLRFWGASPPDHTDPLM